MMAEYVENPIANNLLQEILQDDRFKLVDELIIYTNWVYLIPESKVRERILRLVITLHSLVTRASTRLTSRGENVFHGMGLRMMC